MQREIADRTRFFGYWDDVLELLVTFDVYVNMAREEGFEIAVVEAMQTGLPVVLANAGALPELIEDGISGLLVPAGDAEALANAVQILLRDKEFSSRLGEASKQKSTSQFSIGCYVKHMEDLYLDVFRRNHGRK